MRRKREKKEETGGIRGVLRIYTIYIGSELWEAYC